jgi:hypothetical protein
LPPYARGRALTAPPIRGATMPWGVSTADVLATTGTAATVAQIAAADSVISIYVNRESSASASMSARDLGWIRSAICWQTPWQAAATDLTTRSQYDSLSQDGFSVASTAQWAKVLAPLAARSLKNLSWKGSRTIRTPNVSVPVGSAVDFVLESSDPFSDWETM